MEFDPDISKLENIVTRLLDEYNIEKNKCEQLTLDLAESNAQLEELKEEKITLINEKEKVHSHVSSILSKLSDWEDGMPSTSEKEDTVKNNGSSGQLFSMDTSS